ncbi:Pyruvate formate-lyase 1-activating enzyme; PFL-activating enzyme 1; Formate-C-acetyltransferase-activating enzyme 1 [Erwinia sp. Ejp617]|nr:Pyruvate formate-lyase 1-activating enzyme; PFL-activating enzyme 1; Formate-C-acetyltransferase-activating enzyme 1 [Erwinia sp. Ejp617]
MNQDHTCHDTDGFKRRDGVVIDELPDVSNRVMLDLKQVNDNIHQNLGGLIVAPSILPVIWRSAASAPGSVMSWYWVRRRRLIST